MKKYVLNFNEIDKSDLAYVGGKGANLGEATKASFPVPQGFCVTTEAYRQFIQTSPEMEEYFRRLDQVRYDDLKQIQELGQQIREHLQSLPIPEIIETVILSALETTGIRKAYAVRSSATAEDLPTASFAGQQDTYLNICGSESVLKAVRDCWASLFTDRAISYRAKNGFPHRSVFLSVVVQHMVFPEVSGIMFTADPITGHRNTISIDASYGLGEALVSGLVTADLYQVRSEQIIHKTISKKKIAIYSVPEGGTVTQELPLERQESQALPDERILALAQWGQKIEDYYGSEQDIEWAWADEQFYILQSRPITSLYPVPKVTDDQLHVFLSFGHIQMMTDAMKPMGISIMSKITKFLTDLPIIRSAGGRVFADVTNVLLVKPARNRMLKIMRGMDEVLSSALSEVSQRDEFRHSPFSKKDMAKFIWKLYPILMPVAVKIIANLRIRDPKKAKLHAELLIEQIVKEQVEQLKAISGAETIRLIRRKIGRMAPDVLAKVAVYVATGVIASGTLEKALKKKVGEERTASLLSQLYKSLPGNVTTEIGQKLGDLSDIARKYPEVVRILQEAKDNQFYKELGTVQGGEEFKAAFDRFLEAYGMRCTGEIDISRSRWREDPSQLVPFILSNLRTSSAREHREKFRKGEVEAEQAGKEIVSLFGFFERRKVARLVELYRNLMGMREHHKFTLVLLLDLYKRAMLQEAQTLVKKGVLADEHDVFYFTLEEFIDLLENRFSGDVTEFVEKRKEEYERYQQLNPPRLMTSEGEIVTGKPREVQAPEGSLVGTPVSAGVVEGVARVILRLEDAKLNAGEILVAPYTDPGWTPLFTSAVGLITEVGGMMTHGSVVAREYGIPAVVGIEKATEIIKDGSYIRVDGTKGYVEILSANDEKNVG